MTTDTFAKQVAVIVRGRRPAASRSAAWPRAAGMIAPNMATMLAVITTDAPLTSEACDAALRARGRAHLQPGHGRLGHVDQRHASC